MKKIEFLLIQLEGFYYLNYPDVLNLYNPPDNNIIFKNESLLEIYKWRNGINNTLLDKIGQYEFCSFGHLLSFQEGKKYAQSFINENIFGKKKLFPIIASLAGDFLLIDSTIKNSKIYIYSPNLFITKPIEVYNSIENFIETIYECFNKGIYQYDNNRFLIIDDEKEKEISIKYNPKSEFWE